MNYNRKVVVFTTVTTSILFAYSLISTVYKVSWPNLDNINIITDVVTKKDAESPDNLAFSSDVIATDSIHGSGEPKGPPVPRAIAQYKAPKVITAFYTDSSKAALPRLMRKLHAIKMGRKSKVRIAWLGDSMIEGDYLTQTFRKRMQQFMGGFGVGFIPATSVVAQFRTTATHKWEGDWVEDNFKTKELSGNLFISGHMFHTSDGELHLKDNTVKDSTQPLQKALLCGPIAGPVTITVNGQARQFTPTKAINRLMLDSGTSHQINISINNDKLPVYGLSMEPETGIVVDNFSFRGITGLELNKLDSSFLATVQEENPYDLIVLEYGANLMLRPNDSDYSWYQKHIMPVVARLKKYMPNAEFLIISTADRAFRYGDNWQTAIGINNLVKVQADLAFNSGAAFFNMYASMGGSGTIVKWAESSPSLANKDYIHPNLKGSELLGGMFYDAFMKDYWKLGDNPADLNNYVVTRNKSIIDRNTNLEWCVAGDKDVSWQEAAEWVKSLNSENSQWSLPTVDQLLSLYDVQAQAGEGYERDGQTFVAHINPAFKRIGHGAWAWTQEDISGEKAYTVNLNQGVKVPSLKNDTKYPVRAFAVRKVSADQSY